MATPMTLSIRINADGTAAITGLRRVQGEIQRTGAVIGPVRTQTEGLAAQLKSLALTAGAAVSIGALANSFISANSAAGSLRASLETVTGSTRAATAAWSELQQFAATTPFSLEEAVKGFVKLKALGLDPSREAMLSYANTASAMGKTLNDMVEAVADATAGEFERLKEFGVKASKEGDQVRLTFQGVTTTIGNNAEEIEAYLRRIGEVQFAGAIERQAATLGVALSNVDDSWDQLMVAIGDAGLTAVMVEGLREITGWIDALKTSIAGDLGTDIAATIAQLEAEFSGWGEVIATLPGHVDALTGALASLPNYVVTLRDGTLAIEEQGTAWQAVTELVGFAAQAFIDLPDNLRAAVQIILGEIDILAIQFQAGMDRLGPVAAQAWETIKYAIVSAIQAIKVAVAEMVATVAGQLASLARDMANVAAQVPEVLDIGGMAQSAAAGLNELATSLDGTTANVTQLKEEQAALGKSFADTTDKNKAQANTIKANAAAQVSAIREVIKAGLDEAQANKDRRASQAELNAEFARAVADQEALEKSTQKLTGATDEGAKATGRGAKATNDGATAARGAAQADKEAEQAKKALTAATEANNRAVQGLIDRYLPARQAAEDYAEAQQAVAAAMAGGEGSIALSAEEASTILAGLAQDQAKAADAARREADAFYAAWADAVDGLDDTFKGLWRGLITGQGDVLGNLKETVMEWVADLSYQLLLSPLIVPIQGALMGVMGGGAAGVTGTATSLLGSASNLGGLGSTFSSLSSLASGVSNIFSGAAFSGITAGFEAASGVIGASGYFGGFGANMAMASGAASAGNMSFAIGAAAPYLIPVAAIAAAGIAIFNKWQSDQEPRYGTLAAMTGGSARGLEDSEWGAASGAYVGGSFGLNFGITDKGSKNMEATELTEVYQALADVSDALADFFGEDLSTFIEAELQKMSDFGDGLIHLTENEGDLGGAMAALVERIAQAAGRSSDDIGIAFAGMLGDLSGSAEDVGEQIQAAMLAAVMAVNLSDAFDDDIGQFLGLTGDLKTDLGLLNGYIDQFGASGETSAETLTRLVAQLGVLQTAANQTATDLSSLNAEGVLALSDELVAAFGSLDAAAQAQAFYYDQFTTATEKLVDTIQAAAKQINREIPKLQDSLLQLAADTVTVVQTTAEALQAETATLTTAVTDLGAQAATAAEQAAARLREQLKQGDLDYAEQQLAGAESWAQTIARQREAIARFHDETSAGFAVAMAQLTQTVDEGLATYGDSLRALGYEIDQGAEGFLDSLTKIRDAILDPVATGAGDTATLTTPGDPNAAILAQLLNDLPKTRQGFEDLIGAIDLTTEAGRKLYAGLMALAPQFDLLYDGAEAFTDWLLGVDEVGTATRELEAVFREWGMTLPENRTALEELYQAGILTTEQMAILGAYLQELGQVFSDVSASVADYTDLEIRLASAMGDDALALRLEREQELAAAADETARALLLQIYAAEDAAAAADAAARAAEEMASLQIRLAEAQGDDALALQLRREQELADAASDAARALLLQIYAAEDAAAAAEAAARAAEEMASLQIRLAEAQGDEELALRLRREQELAAATDDATRAILEQIYALEDEARAREAEIQAANDAYAALEKSVNAQKEAINASYQDRVDALNAERDAIQAASDARLDALDAERTAAEEALSAAQSALSSIQSAIDSLNGQVESDPISQAIAAQQLAAWGAAGLLPSDPRQLDETIAAATRIDAEDYTSEAAYRAAQGSTLSGLLLLEKAGLSQVSVAESTLDAIERQTAEIQDGTQAQLDAIQQQIDSSAAWRDAELERLDQLLEDARTSVEIATGTYEATLSLEEAIAAFNTAIALIDPDAPTLTLDGLSETLGTAVVALDDRVATTGAALEAGMMQQTSELSAIRGEIVALRRDMAIGAGSSLTALKSVDDRLKRWDDDGLPVERDADTTTTYVLRAA